jgi:serine/threonine-protein kinase
VFEGRFRIEERVAEGGFAVVYKAVQVALDRPVALKVLKMPRFHDEVGRAEFRDRFAAEARTIALIRHPHIVDVYDFSVATLGSGELAPWMALEWVDGETLASFLKKRRDTGGRVQAPLEAFEFLRPAIQALAHAHERGVVHRDIKPANIMVERTPGGTSLRVLDFGIAKIMSDERHPSGNTRTESMPAFSPHYAAPEQVAFSRTGPWTDVHALGLVLSELMTGTQPFGERDADAHVFELVMAAQRPTPAAQGRDVGAFEPVLAKALSLSPKERWKNAGAFLAALDEAKLGRPPAVAAAPRRGPSRKVVASLGALALGGGLALGVSALRRARRVPAPPPVATVPTVVSAPIVPPAPPPAPPVAAAPAPSPPRRVVPKRRGSPPAPVQPQVNDGADLFNDTK